MNKSQHPGFSANDRIPKFQVTLQQDYNTLSVMNKSQYLGLLSLLPNILIHFKENCQASGFATVLKYPLLLPNSVLRIRMPDEDRNGEPELFSDDTILWREFTFTVPTGEHSTTPKSAMTRVDMKANIRLSTGGAENSTFLFYSS